jgi:hypothetical protein
MKPWFDVDHKGLQQILARKGKEFVLYELIQNAWDENTSKVSVELARIPHTRTVSLRVADDNPEGFVDLAHAFTLFAPSAKKADAEKRGRFNLGEKTVIALCQSAKITSTTGTVSFGPSGRSRSNKRTESGSVFEGILQMTDEEMAECGQAIGRLLPPVSVTTLFNGVRLRDRLPIEVFVATLPTEIADEEGQLRPTKRKTEVQIHEVADGETATLYEMGIPVVATEDRWHINVNQKVPLTIDRDNVSPAYLSQLRALVLEKMTEKINVEDVNDTWVKDALQKHADDLPEQTIRKVMDLRFGEQRVAYDPSDPEANNLAVSQGYSIVHGRNLSRTEWGAVKRFGIILPAGQVTPSPRPYSPDGRDLELIDPDAWTENIKIVVDFAHKLAERLLGRTINVEVANAPWWGAGGGGGVRATYGPSGTLVLNHGILKDSWFAGPMEEIISLIIHEFGHEYCLDHLSKNYYRALTDLAGKITLLALTEPELFGSIRSRK